MGAKRVERTKNRVLYIMENRGKVVAATKRNDDGKLFPKQVRPAAMDIDKILNPSILGRVPLPVLSKLTKAKTEKCKDEEDKENGSYWIDHRKSCSIWYSERTC